MIDLTQATLQEWAMKQGIDADIESMTQAQKTMLRYQYVLSQGRAAMNDFQRTQDTWHNQTTILKQSFIALNTVIGQGLINALKPALKGLNAFLGAVIDFSQQVVNALGKIFGWKYEITGGGIADDTLADLEDMSDSLGSLGDNPLSDALDGSDAVADALDDATEAAEEFKATMLGFDELHVLNDISETVAKATGKGSGLGGDAGDDGSAGASGSGLGNLGGYDSALEGHLEKVESLFESEIDNLYDLGKHISDTLKKTLDGIDWDSIYQKARNFGKGLAQFLNGLLQPETFYTIGKTIANSLNTAVQAGIGFVYTFDWKKAGDSFNAGLMGIFKNIKWNEIFRLADDLGKGIADYLNHLFTPQLFAEVGIAFANALNTAFHFLDSFGKTFSFVNFGDSLVEGLNNFLDKIEWNKALSAAKSIGTGIAEAINAFINPNTFKKVGHAVAEALKTALTLFFSVTGNIEWGDLGTNVARAINTFFEDLEPKDFTDGVNGIIQGLNDAIANFKDTLKTDEMRQKIAEIIDGLDWKGIGSLLKEATKIDFALAIVGFLVGGFKENPVRKALELGFGGLAEVIKLVIAGKLLGVGGASAAAGAAGATTGASFAAGLSAALPAIAVLGAAILATIVITQTGIDEKLTAIVDSLYEKLGYADTTTQEYLNRMLGDQDQFWEDTMRKAEANGYDVAYVWDDINHQFVKIQRDANGVAKADYDSYWEERHKAQQDGGDSSLAKLREYHNQFNKNTVDSLGEAGKNLNKFWEETSEGSARTGEDITTNNANAWKSAAETTKKKLGEMSKDTTDKNKEIQENVKRFSEQVNKDYSGLLEKIASESDKKWGEAENKTSTHLGNLDTDVYNKLSSVNGSIETNISDLPGTFDSYFGDAKNNALGQLDDLEVESSGILSRISGWLDSVASFIGDISFDIAFPFGYAAGGFPDAGEVFLAREGGSPEMVGRIGTRTAVANNDQIVAGIKAGVMDAMMQVYSATGSNRNSSAPLTNDITVKVGEETLYRAVVRGKQKHERRYQTVAVVQ